MEMDVLKKRISTFRGEGGRVRITDEGLLMEILQAWEQWTGPAKQAQAHGSKNPGPAKRKL